MALQQYDCPIHADGISVTLTTGAVLMREELLEHIKLTNLPVTIMAADTF
jgi:hypothetical protein